MARPLRVEYPGAVYHVTTYGNAGQPVFLADKDRRLFLEILGKTVDRWGWLCHAYCLMEDHYHLLIETPEPNLSRGMRQLNGEYTQAFNRKHGRGGHLFQGRFKSLLVEKDRPMLEMCRQMVLIPVRSGAAKKPKDWAWSSYGATSGKEEAPAFLHREWILDQVGAGHRDRFKRYRQFVKRGMKAKESPVKARSGLWIGSDEFGRKIKGMITKGGGASELTRDQVRAGEPSLGSYFPKKVKRNKARRNAAILKAYREGRFTQREIGQHLGLHYVTVSRIVRAEEEIQREEADR
jgi:REP element-mobilizing transposase RayT